MIIKDFEKELINAVGYQMHHSQIVYGTKNHPNRICYPAEKYL